MFSNVTIKARLIGVLAVLSILLLIIGAQGLMGMRAGNTSLGSVYANRLIPTGQIAQINLLMLENVRQLHLASMHDPRLPESKLHDHPITVHLDVVENNIGTIGGIWKEYTATTLTPEAFSSGVAVSRSIHGSDRDSSSTCPHKPAQE